MSKFDEWCKTTKISVDAHQLIVLIADGKKKNHAAKVVAESGVEYYTDPNRVAGILIRLGKKRAAQYIQDKLPSSKAIRSGDLGEILCNAYLLESTSFNLGVKRLRWKDHKDMAMRGEDVLAFSLGKSGGRLKILKAEVKSRAQMSTAVISEARAALSSNRELPTPHAISFISDRLRENGDISLSDALDDAQLKNGIKISQVTHMLFTFSGNDPSNLMTRNLKSYTGTVPQQYVALKVESHQDFIKTVFEKIGK